MVWYEPGLETTRDDRVQVNVHDLSVLRLDALRYLHGRMSYAVGEGCDIVTLLLPKLDGNFIKTMRRDLKQEAERVGGLDKLGMECDGRRWTEFAAALDAEIARRDADAD